jgi:predicted O-methyltransferase YrrM
MKENYILSFLKHNNPILDEILYSNLTRNDVQPSSGIEVIKILQLLLLIKKPKLMLELGTSNGYSAIACGEILKKFNAKLITVDSKERLYKEAIKNIKKANLENTISPICDDVINYLNKTTEKFDFIYQDSGKSTYPETIEKIIEILNPNGIIVADDTLFKITGKRKSLANAVHKYNELVFNNKKLFSTIIPFGDGLTISIKI